MTGLLLIQLGTPDAPTPEAVKPYLRQFLSDPRVIEDQGWKWKLILNGVILRKRPRESAAKYARIWDAKTGSPLMISGSECTICSSFIRRYSNLGYLGRPFS